MSEALRLPALVGLLTVLQIAVLALPIRRVVPLALLRRNARRGRSQEAIQSAWRIAEVAIADLYPPLPRANRHPEPLELAGLALDHEAWLDPVPVRRCATLAQRARAHERLIVHDAEDAAMHAEMIYQAVMDILADRQSFRAWYRWV